MRSTHVAHARLAALITVLVVTLSACTSGNGGSSEGGATGGKDTGCADAAGLSGPIEDRGFGSAPGGTITLEASEFAFDPTCVEASGGGTLEVTVTNVGSALHNIRLDPLGIDQDVQPGESITVEIAMPASGPVPFVCKYHIANGMQGAFLAG